ncbi:hypothetical protein RJ639_038919 [Escallonia herrerae]|uniref:Uncharacterized protein n=1 Tax=Escallonia herrerae TaxID=1293975 RepID=A0AA89BFR3_9ASTE|nr:hypothetical protein RJ639_038919 [Escallonia herrerae]
MASETAVSDHPSAPEQVKEEVLEVVKAIEQDIVTQAKEEKPEPEDTPNPEVILPESKEKVEDTQIEPPIIEEVKKSDAEEETKSEDLPSRITESAKEIDEQPVVEEVKKTEEEKPKVKDLPSAVVLLAESEAKIEEKIVGPPVSEQIKESDVEEKPTIKGPPIAEDLLAAEEKYEEKQVENPVTEEVNEIDEEEKPKAEDPPTQEVPVAAVEEKIEEKQIEFPVIEEVKTTDEEEAAKIEEPLRVPSAVVEEKIVEKQVESPVIEEIKKIDEEETPKAEIEEKEVEPPVIEEEKKSSGEENPKAVYLPSPAVPPVELQEKIEDKQIDSPVTEEAKKPDSMVVDVPLVDADVPEPDTPSVPEAVADNIKGQREEEVLMKTAEKQEEQLTEKQPTEPSVDAVDEEKELVEELPVKELEPAAQKDVGISEVESKTEKVQESVPALEEKPEEKAEVFEQTEKESAVVVAKESLEVEVAKNEEIPLASKVEEAELKEEETAKETGGTSCTRKFRSIENDQVDPKRDEVQSVPAEVTENGSTEVNEKEVGAEADVVEADNDVKNVETAEENGAVHAIVEESIEPVKKEVNDVASSISAVTVNSLEVEDTTRDIDLVAENGKEELKDETVASVETTERKSDEVLSTASKEPVEESLTPEAEVKGEEPVQTEETKPEKEKEVDELVKPDIPNVESNNGDKKTREDPPKEEVSVKSTQKQSNNIMSKVKQTLVKAKRAIVGKSSSTKAAATETKGDVTV